MIDSGITHLIKKICFSRKCYFQDERKLLYFNKYTQVNCFYECKSLFMEKSCHCVQFDYPSKYFRMKLKLKAFLSISGHSKLRICGYLETQCVVNIRIAFSDPTSSMSRSCDCLNDCDKILYPYDIIVDKISAKHLQNFTSSGDFLLESEISIFYSENVFLGHKRVLRSNFATFLTNIGALLWLFLGASAMSVVEIIYFFTLRFFNNLWVV